MMGRWLDFIFQYGHAAASRKAEEKRPSTMSFNPMEDEFVPQAFRPCLGTAPQGCGNSA